MPGADSRSVDLGAHPRPRFLQRRHCSGLRVGRQLRLAKAFRRWSSFSSRRRRFLPASELEGERDQRLSCNFLFSRGPFCKVRGDSCTLYLYTYLYWYVYVSLTIIQVCYSKKIPLPPAARSLAGEKLQLRQRRRLLCWRARASDPPRAFVGSEEVREREEGGASRPYGRGGWD